MASRFLGQSRRQAILALATGRDRRDELVAQWAAERPELDSEVMAVVGRLLLVGMLIGRRLDAWRTGS